MNEVWKDIPEHKGYKASNMGRIKSMLFGRVRVLKPRIKSNGYVTYNLGGKSRDLGAHRLVLMAFVGMPLKGIQACHNDNNPSNNKLDNLRWDTKSGNMSDKTKHGTHRNASNAVAKLTESDIVDILKLGQSSNMTYDEIAFLYKVSQSTIGHIMIGKSWRHVFKEWKCNTIKKELV